MRLTESHLEKVCPGDVITFTVTAFGRFENPSTGEPDELAFEIDTIGIVFTSLAAGTRIATPAGEKPVEEFAAGDFVTTASGHAVPVKFVGVQTVRTTFTPADRRLPVRFAAGALGPPLQRA